VLIGRNNRQNDQLTFRLAGDYDLWFHAQEIPGSHVLLRLKPGSVPDEADLQLPPLAPITAAPAKVTKCQYLHRTKARLQAKGAKPGIAIYKQERILWGSPSGTEFIKLAGQKLKL